MKVKIGKYLPYYSAYGMFDFLEKIIGEDRYDRLSEGKLFTFIDKVLYKVSSLFDRKVYVKIHPWDTWSLDHTLALIIRPALIQLKETSHGYFIVDESDIPLYVQAQLKAWKKDNEDIHNLYYNWVLDEMIWAFQQVLDDAFYTKYDEGYDRMQRGLIFFGKYYRGLWD